VIHVTDHPDPVREIPNLPTTSMTIYWIEINAEFPERKTTREIEDHSVIVETETRDTTNSTTKVNVKITKYFRQ
jgi:hypothetical protein